jgi:hypothetical protein
MMAPVFCMMRFLKYAGMMTFAWPLFLLKDGNNMCETSIAIVFALLYINLERERERGKIFYL